jgi:DNA-binding transcriptional LysR family regulator
MRLAELKFRELMTLEAGEIRVGASDMTLRFFLLPYLEEFHRTYPRIKVHVTNNPTPETLRSLKAAQIDFGVVSMPLPEEKGLKSMPVGSLQDCFIASDAFAAFRGREVSAEELAGAPLIMLEPCTSTRRYVEGFFSAFHTRPNVEFELATSDLIVEFAVRGMGIGCVVKDFARPALERGDVFEINLSDPMPPRPICIVTKEGIPVSPAGQRLLGLILK